MINHFLWVRILYRKKLSFLLLDCWSRVLIHLGLHWQLPQVLLSGYSRYWKLQGLSARVLWLYCLNLPGIQLASYLVFRCRSSFFPFLYIDEVQTGNSLDEISKAKLLESFDMGFLPRIQELKKYFILASIGWIFLSSTLICNFVFCF